MSTFTRTLFRIRFLLTLGLCAWLGSAASAAGPVPQLPLMAAGGTTTLTDLQNLHIPLGLGQNVIDIDKIFYVGAGVKKFRIKFAVEVPSWPKDLEVSFLDEGGKTIARYRSKDKMAYDDIWTPYVDGGSMRIRIRTGKTPVFLGGDPANLEIRGVEAVVDKSAKQSVADACPLELGVETIAYRFNEVQPPHLFYIDLPKRPKTTSVYMSPYHINKANDVGAKVQWVLSDDTSTAPAEGSSWKKPVRDDTGIYQEFNRKPRDGRRLYVFAETEDNSYYFLTVQQLRKQVGTKSDPFVVELDGTLDGDAAPEISAANDAKMGQAVAAGVRYDAQVGAFVKDRATYDRRAEETLVLTSAVMLAATEGYFRLGNVKMFHGADDFRDVDLFFDDTCGRAWAKFHGKVGAVARMNIHLEELHNPLFGGATIVHEWGHYELSIADEYLEGTEGVAGSAVDVNSLMGTASYGLEFCGDLNHRSQSPQGKIGAASAWRNLESAYQVEPPRPATSANVSYPQNQATYLDVLHALQAKLRLRHVRNPKPTGTGGHPKCGTPGFNPGGLGVACAANSDCATEACDPVAKKCVPTGNGVNGNYCAKHGDCASNRCKNQSCEPLAELGDYCGNGHVCESGVCDKYNDRKCIPAPGKGAKGEYCTHNNQCAKGNCDANRCKVKAALGGTCSSNGGCESGACDTAKDKCVPLTGTGGTGTFCTQHNHCKSNRCVSSKCLAKGSLGDKCDNGRICKSGVCDKYNERKCIPKPAKGRDGDYCTHNNQCKSGNCPVSKPGRGAKCKGD